MKDIKDIKITETELSVSPEGKYRLTTYYKHHAIITNISVEDADKYVKAGFKLQNDPF